MRQYKSEPMEKRRRLFGWSVVRILKGRLELGLREGHAKALMKLGKEPFELFGTFGLTAHNLKHRLTSRQLCSFSSIAASCLGTSTLSTPF